MTTLRRLVALLLLLLALPAEAATRTYPRPADQPILPEQLQRALDVALDRTGTTIQVGSTTNGRVVVTP